MSAPDELPLTSDYTPRPRDPAPAPAALTSPPAPDLPGHSRRGLLAWLADEIFSPAFRPLRAKLNVWRWADENVHLDGRATGRPGRYDSSITPWTRAFQETLTDPRYDELHVIKASRGGFTEAAFNCIRFMPGNAPGPVLFAIHSTRQGVKSNKNRLIPTLDHAIDDPGVDRRTDVTGAMIRLPNMVIAITGSHTEEAFRSDGYRLVIGDEIEVVDEIEDSGSLHNLMRSRKRGIPDSKLLTMSKPKRWCSAHHREVVTGTCEALLVPCPHCGTFQELTLDGNSPTHQLRIEKPLRPGLPPPSPPLALKEPAKLGRLVYSHCTDLTGAWDFERIANETYYQCVSGCRITGEERLDASHAWLFPGDDPGATFVREALLAGKTLRAKYAMANAGRWLRTNPRPIPRKRTQHHSDLYSLDPDMTFAHLALIFATAATDPGALATAMNENMGLPVQEKITGQLDESLVEACRSPYRCGELPFRPDILLVGGDTQQAYQKAVVIAARLDGPDYELAVVDWHYIQTPADFDALMDAPIPVPPSSPPVAGEPDVMRPALAFVDAAGHRTGEVYDQHLANPTILPCWGDPQNSLNKLVWKTRVPHNQGHIDIYHVADAKFKQRIYHGMIGKSMDIKAAWNKRHSAEGGPTLSVLGLPGRLHLPGLPRASETEAEFARRWEEFKSELTSEYLDEVGKWIKFKGRPNDFGDALKYAVGAFDYIRPILESERATKPSGPVMDERGRITRPS